MPVGAALPMPPLIFFRLEPDEEQDTSYFALSVNISSFSSNVICGSQAI